MPGTRKLGRATANRTAMLRAMVTFLLENGKIETTVTRAKEVKAMRFLTTLLQNIKRETAVTAVSSRLAHAAVTQLRWQSSN